MTDPDRRWVRKARRGDRRALETLYERHKQALLGFLARLVGDRALAEEVFQEVWVKVLVHIDGYRESGATFRAWLFRIGSNTAVDRMRRETLRRGPSLDAPRVHGDRRWIDTVESDLPGPAREGEARAMLSDLSAALARLNDGQRAAILLRHQQGMSYAEVARSLGVAEGTAKTMVHRGVNKLRDLLAEWLDDGS